MVHGEPISDQFTVQQVLYIARTDVLPFRLLLHVLATNCFISRLLDLSLPGNGISDLFGTPSFIFCQVQRDNVKRT